MFTEEDALFWDVLSKCEQALIVRVPKFDNEQLLMEQMKLLTVRAHRLMSRIRDAGDKRLDIERYESELTRVQGRMLQCIMARIRLQLDMKKKAPDEAAPDPLIDALMGSLDIWDDQEDL